MQYTDRVMNTLHVNAKSVSLNACHSKFPNKCFLNGSFLTLNIFYRNGGSPFLL